MPPKMAVIACAVLEHEVRAFSEGLAHVACMRFLPQGLHNEPPKLRASLQEAIDGVETQRPEVDAIVAVYGLCSGGVEGVRTARCVLALPRAHDCITLLLGGKERYAEYHSLHPGTYWYSPGWNRHHTPPGKQRHETLRASYVAQFGEDDADYLMEQEQAWFKTYDRATFVDLGVGDTRGDERFTRNCATWLGWRYDRVHGDPGLLKALLAGEWDDERFLVLRPGQTLRMTADDRIIEACVDS